MEGYGVVAQQVAELAGEVENGVPHASLGLGSGVEERINPGAAIRKGNLYPRTVYGGVQIPVNQSGDVDLIAGVEVARASANTRGILSPYRDAALHKARGVLAVNTRWQRNVSPELVRSRLQGGREAERVFARGIG